MSILKIQANFAGGELDPALRERTTLNKFQNGLSVGRNIAIGKTGRIVSVPGRKHIATADSSDTKLKIIPLGRWGWLEWGDSYLKWHKYDDEPAPAVTAHGYLQIDIDFFRFVPFLNVDTVFKFLSILPNSVGGPTVSVFGAFTGLPISTDSGIFSLGTAPTLSAFTDSSTGYAVDYAVTQVNRDLESDYLEITGKDFPGSSENNKLEINVDTALSELRVYRRPAGSGEYGLIGTAPANAFAVASFVDIGQQADYTQRLQVEFDRFSAAGAPENIQWADGGVYQQRVFLVEGNYLYFSQLLGDYTTSPKFLFYKKFPISDGAVHIKLTSTGTASPNIRHCVDSDGFVIFTDQGIYYYGGAVSASNLSVSKRGPWVSSETLPPVAVPGGLLFVDEKTNSVRNLVFNDSLATYVADEVSIFSNHMFQGKTIVSWAFEDGKLPLLWVAFDDGTGALFSYEATHELQAWTTLDTPGINFEQFINLPKAKLTHNSDEEKKSRTFCVIEKGGQRYIEEIVPRYINEVDLVADPELDKKESIAAMSSFVSWSHLILDDLTDDDITLDPVVPNDWDGFLNLTCVDDAIFPDPGIGAVGTKFKHFHPVDRTEVILEVIGRTDDNSIVVQASSTFPLAYATNARLYEMKDTFTGLDHLDGENVSVIADGYVIASPNNNIENYNTLTPASGSLTLSAEYAIVHIGRPYTMDIETLEVDTGERGQLLDSKSANKMYVKTLDSRGLYVASRFPADDLVEGDDVTGTNSVAMDGADSYDVNYEDENPIVGNRYDQPTSRRLEVTLPGSWKGNGKVAIRQVDPVHFEILSIIPDVDVLERR